MDFGDRGTTRREYLLGVAAGAGLAGCTGDGGNADSPTPVRESPAPDSPLEARYGVGKREAVYRETEDGSLIVEAALPDGEGLFPTLVHVHGGAWQYGSPGYGGMELLAQAGMAVVSVEYRLGEAATFPGQVRDVTAAMKWVRANEPGWNLDADRVALTGDSAGAHLAALVAAAPDHGNFQPEGFDVEASAAPDALIPHYGIFDLRREGVCEGESDDDAMRALFGPECSTAEQREASPVTHLSGDHPPVLLFHGSADSLVPVASSREYRDALVDAGVPVEYQELDGVEHGYLEPENPDQERVLRETHERMVNYLFEEPWSDDGSGD